MEPAFLGLALIAAYPQLPHEPPATLVDYEIHCTASGSVGIAEFSLGYRVQNGLENFRMCTAHRFATTEDGTLYMFASLDEDLQDGCEAWKNGHYFRLVVGYLEQMGSMPDLRDDHGQFLMNIKEELTPSLQIDETDSSSGINVRCQGPER